MTFSMSPTSHIVDWIRTNAWGRRAERSAGTASRPFFRFTNSRASYASPVAA